MSRSRIHDHNRRVTRITGTRGKGQEHPEAAITRGFQEWYRNCPPSELDSIRNNTYYGHYKDLLVRHGSHEEVMRLLAKEYATSLIQTADKIRRING